MRYIQYELFLLRPAPTVNRILIADDDPGLCQQLISSLASQGLTATSVSSGELCLKILSQQEFDVILLDWNMPDVSGLEICKRFRESGGSTPIIFVTGRHGIQDKEQGLYSGADDYITKPFDIRELLARLTAIQRRSGQQKNILSTGDLSLNPFLLVVETPSGKAHLTRAECKILQFLLENRNRYFTSAHLFDALWSGEEKASASDDVIKVHIRLLRKKLEKLGAASLIETQRGSGYIVKDAN